MHFPFLDEESRSAFLLFRSKIEKGHYSNSRRIFIVTPPGAPGLALGRWLGEVEIPWPRMLASLLAGDDLDQQLLPLAIEQRFLKESRGRVVVLCDWLLSDPAHFRALGEYLVPHSGELKKPWWLAVVDMSGLVAAEDRDGVVVRLADPPDPDTWSTSYFSEEGKPIPRRWSAGGN